MFLSKLEYSGRIDSEYYSPHFLNYENIISEKNGIELKDLSNFLIGPFGSSFTVDNYTDDTSFRYIRGKDVKPMKLMDDDNAYMPKEDYERLIKYALKENDILVSVVGTLGNAALITKKDLPAIFSCKSTVLRPFNINPPYLLVYINSKYGRDLLIRKERGAIQKGLNLDDLKTLDVYKPSIAFQKRIEYLFNLSLEKSEFSKQTYTQAENLLLEALGLKDFKPSQEKVNIKSFKDSFLSSGRLDAEYYQLKYEEIESKITQIKHLKIKDIFDLLSNPSPSNYKTRGIKVIKTKNIRIPSVEVNNIVDHTNKDCLLIQKNDLLFASMGVGSLGRISFIDSIINDCTIDGTIKVLRSKENWRSKNIEIPVMLFLSSSLKNS